jgi:hypothetical protein
MTYVESGLRFIFPKNWRVKKYDEHHFYRALSGSGLKGVDFIGVLNQKKLILIEVKNYKIRFPAKPPPIQEKILGLSPSLVQTMTYKVDDTFLAVNTIIKYYQRRWWYAPFLKLFDYLPIAYLLRFEWAYWTYVQRLIFEQKKQVDLVLWLELETIYEDVVEDEIETARQRIEQSLKTTFPNYNVYLCYMGKNDYAKLGLQVVADDSTTN